MEFPALSLQRPSAILIVTLLCVSLIPVSSYPTWTAPSSNAPLRRMVVHPSTGDIYVAGKDAIFQLASSPLQTSFTAKTGPLTDNKGCFPNDWFSSQSCFDNNFQTKIQSNFNQLLLLNESGDSILSCENLQAGTCNLRLASNVSTISRSDEEIFKAGGFPAVEMIVVTRDEDSNSAGVISYDYLGRPALFLVTHMGALSSVKPSEISVWGMSYDDLLQPLVGSVNFPLNFPFDILSAFGSGEFVYFVATDSSSAGGTLIARICRNDQGMAANTLYAYLEAYIECKGNSKTYKYMKSFYVGKVGTLLASSVGNDDVLMGVFNEKIDGTGASALCVVSVPQINAKYRQAVENCRNGISGSRGFARGSSPRACTNTLKTLWDGTGCSPPVVDISQEIPSSDPILSSAFYEIPASPSGSLTAVTFTVAYSTDTVAFAGKSDGTVDKIDVRSNSSSRLIRTLSTSSFRRILSLELNPDRSVVYALSDSNLTAIPVQGCNALTTCFACLTPPDPFCGFCVPKLKCTELSNCQQSVSNSSLLLRGERASECAAFPTAPPSITTSTPSIRTPRKTTSLPNVTQSSQETKCVYGQWNSWSECDRSCGHGFGLRKRLRELSESDGASCQNPLLEYFQICSCQLGLSLCESVRDHVANVTYMLGGEIRELLGCETPSPTSGEHMALPSQLWCVKFFFVSAVVVVSISGFVL